MIKTSHKQSFSKSHWDKWLLHARNVASHWQDLIVYIIATLDSEGLNPLLAASQFTSVKINTDFLGLSLNNNNYWLKHQGFMVSSKSSGKMHSNEKLLENFKVFFWKIQIYRFYSIFHKLFAVPSHIFSWVFMLTNEPEKT